MLKKAFLQENVFKNPYPNKEFLLQTEASQNIASGDTHIKFKIMEKRLQY